MTRRFGILPILAVGLVALSLMLASAPAQARSRDSAAPRTSSGASDYRQGQKLPKPRPKPGPRGEPDGD